MGARSRLRYDMLRVWVFVLWSVRLTFVGNFEIDLAPFITNVVHLQKHMGGLL